MIIKHIQDDEIRMKAITYSLSSDYNGTCDSEEESLNEFIPSAFNWVLTPEGHEFWRKIYIGCATSSL